MKLILRRKPNTTIVEHKNDTLKDFIYLDKPRVEQFVAQFERGLPKTSSRESSHIEKMRANLDAVVASANLDATEGMRQLDTVSMDLALYEIFEDDAAQAGYFSEGDIPEQGLFKIKAQVRLINYGDMSDKIMTLSELTPAVNRLAADSNRPSSSLAKKELKLIEMNKTEEEKKQVNAFQDMANIVSGLFGSEVFTIFYQNNMTIGTAILDREMLRMRNTGLLTSTGDILSEEWTVVGLATKQDRTPISDESLDPMAKAIITMEGTLDELKHQLHPDSKARLVTPIAIYRVFSGDKKRNEKHH